MKYVAFLDILGFKNMIAEMKDHKKAQDFIKNFSNTIYKVFQCFEIDSTVKIQGYVISDSLILYSNDISENSLVNLIKLVEAICREQFIQNGVLIRGGIAKGYFDKIKATELQTLKKTLIVGESYVEAYILEESTKIIGVNLASGVYQDILDFNTKIKQGFTNDKSIESKVIKYKNKKKEGYLLKYIDLDFLLEKDNLFRFVNLAINANWLEHYYNTLSFALQNERSSKKKKELFIKIVRIIVDNKKKSLNLFIENAFKDGVEKKFKVYFLKHVSKSLLSTISK